MKTYNFLTFVHIEKNIGYGHGIITGLNACETDFIGWTHADLQCKPEDVIKAIKMITSKKRLGMSHKRIVVSTSGVPKMIKKMAHEVST